MATIPSSIPGNARGFGSQVSRRYRAKLPPVHILAPGLLVVVAMLIPLAYLIVRSIGASDTAWELLFRVRTLQTLGRTALLVATVTASSAMIAIPLAWLTTRTDLPLKRAWTVVVALPLVVPTFVGGFLFVSAFGPKGLLQQLLETPFGVDRLPDLFGLEGATFTLAILSYPYVFLTVRAALLNLDPAIEESARNLGHGAFSVFMRITLPQLRPAIAAGALLVALYTISDFGAVSLMRYPTFTWVIFQQFESAFDRSIAAVMSLVLVSLATFVLLLDNYTRGRQRFYRTGAGSAKPPGMVRLGRWRFIATGFLVFVAGLALALPMGILAYWLVRGATAGEPVLLLWAATRNSLFVSFLAAGITVAMAIPVATLLVRYPSRLNRVIEPISYIGYALPGVVVALALVFFGANYVRPLYQTNYLLVFAYAVLFFPVALGAVRSSLLQISPRLEDAAQGLGSHPIFVTARITVPLLMPGLTMAWSLVFLLTMKELPATLILGPLGFKTLATSVWAASSEAFFAQAAAPALTLILISSVPMAFLVLRERRQSN